MEIDFFCISSKRPQNVPLVQKLVPRKITWITRCGEKGDYLRSGAENVLEADGLVKQRNLALEVAFERGHACWQVSDDGEGFFRLVIENGKKRRKPTDFDDLEREFRAAAAESGMKLFGLPPTANAFYASEKIKVKNFIIADCILVLPSSPRFDENVRLKEDYDFTLQHIKTYGAAIRLDYLLAEYKHYDNAGGCVSFRTEELEAQAVAYLKKKWPGCVRDNPKRKNEILLTV